MLFDAMNSKAKRLIQTLPLLWAILLLISPAKAFASEAPEVGLYYKVEKGDTLWDLSRRFRASPFTWPGLWSDNGQIPNPHWIYPGQRIRIQFREKTDENRQVPVEKEAPEVAAATDVSLRDIVPHYYYPGIDAIGFVRQTAAASSARIVAEENGRHLMGDGDTVHLKRTGKTPLSVGKRYTVYRILEPAPGSPVGRVQHYITGFAEITEISGVFSKARITATVRAMKVGDLLMPYRKRNSEIPLVPARTNFDGAILAAEEHGNILGMLHVAFIDRGADHGVENGQFYEIYREKAVADGNSQDASFSIALGKILVIHTEAQAATVLITDSHREIEPGERIRTFRY